MTVARAAPRRAIRRREAALGAGEVGSVEEEDQEAAQEEVRQPRALPRRQLMAVREEGVSPTVNPDGTGGPSSPRLHTETQGALYVERKRRARGVSQ